MKKAVALLLFVIVGMMVVSCKQNHNDNPAGADGFDITIESKGDFVELTQSEFTGAAFAEGAAFAGTGTRAEVKGLLAVQIYVAPRGGTSDGDYKPYAHGLFEDWSSLAFKGNAQSRYKIVASLVADAQQWLEVKSDVYGLPFGAKVIIGGVVYSTKSGFSGLEAGEACFKDGTSYKTPSLDRYYGELTDVVADSKATVSLFLNRTVFGMAYDITGLSSGKVIATVAGAPAYIITPITGKQTVVYSMSDVKNAWKLSNEEVKHSETKNLTLVHVDEQGSSKELYNADVKLTCKTVTTVRATMGDRIEIVVDDAPMTPGDVIVLGSGNGDDALHGATSVYLSSQQDVEALGALKLKKLTGCLTIDNFRAEITSLEPLSSIESIEDVLNIVNYKASGFRGLHNLKHLGSLYLDNVEASDYSAFSQVRNLNTLQSSNTTGFSGLGILSALHINITKENGDVVINFPNLRYAKSLYISGGMKLREVRFGALESVGSINVSDLSVITIVDFSKLVRVSGDFWISICSGLTFDMSGLTSIGGNFFVQSCSGLAFEMSGLTSIGGNLSISSCSGLSSLNMAGLTSIGGYFDIYSCSGLSSINMAGLNTVRGYFKIYDCDKLIALPILSSSLRIYGEVRINSNDLITNLDGLANVEYLGSSVTISSNSKLVDFCALKKHIKDPARAWSISSNGYNPTLDQIGGSECSKPI